MEGHGGTWRDARDRATLIREAFTVESLYSGYCKNCMFKVGKTQHTSGEMRLSLCRRKSGHSRAWGRRALECTGAATLLGLLLAWLLAWLDHHSILSLNTWGGLENLLK